MVVVVRGAPRRFRFGHCSSTQGRKKNQPTMQCSPGPKRYTGPHCAITPNVIDR